jgi:hypothetical protein
MISQSVARSGTCASNVSPKIPRKGDLVRTFEQMMFPGGTGPVPYRFRRRPILDLKILLFEEDRGSVALLDPPDIQWSVRELARPRLRPVFSTQPVPGTAWSIADRRPIKDRFIVGGNERFAFSLARISLMRKWRVVERILGNVTPLYKYDAVLGDQKRLDDSSGATSEIAIDPAEVRITNMQS